MSDIKTDFKLKCKNEDFIVTEVPLMPTLFPKKNSDYTYIWLEKIGFTTFDAVEKIKDFFGLDYTDINTEGLKDEDAITFQIMSIKKILSNRGISKFNKRRNKFKVKQILGYGKTNVTERLLHGNSFKIVIRNLNKNTAEKFHNFCLTNRFITFINYYDNQRFGTARGPYNNHLIGKAIVENHWKQAFLELQKKKDMTSTTCEKSYRNFFKTINPKKLSFFVSAYNSFLWNNTASRSLQNCNLGKKFNFKNVGKLFLPQNHIFKSCNLYSVEGYEFSEKSFKATRKIITRNSTATTTVFSLGIEKDELHKNKRKVTVSFLLSTGCYATMLIKQLFLKISVVS